MEFWWLLQCKDLFCPLDHSQNTVLVYTKLILLKPECGQASLHMDLIPTAAATYGRINPGSGFYWLIGSEIYPGRICNGSQLFLSHKICMRLRAETNCTLYKGVRVDGLRALKRCANRRTWFAHDGCRFKCS